MLILSGLTSFSNIRADYPIFLQIYFVLGAIPIKQKLKYSS